MASVTAEVTFDLGFELFTIINLCYHTFLASNGHYFKNVVRKEEAKYDPLTCVASPQVKRSTHTCLSESKMTAFLRTPNDTKTRGGGAVARGALGFLKFGEIKEMAQSKRVNCPPNTLFWNCSLLSENGCPAHYVYSLFRLLHMHVMTTCVALRSSTAADARWDGRAQVTFTQTIFSAVRESPWPKICMIVGHDVPPNFY